MLSPLLFSIYTNEMTVHRSNVKVLKYADNMALVGLLLKDNAVHEEAYFSQATALQASKLGMNVASHPVEDLLLRTRAQSLIRP